MRKRTYLVSNEKFRELVLPDTRFTVRVQFGMQVYCVVTDAIGYTYEEMFIEKTNPRWTLFVDLFEKKAEEYYTCDTWSLNVYREAFIQRQRRMQ